MNTDPPPGTTGSSITQPSHIVGIGASAGGLEALEQLFRTMPSDTGMAFVVIQHLSPDLKRRMGEPLDRFTAMQIVAVAGRVTVKPNTIYLQSPAMDLVIEGNELAPILRQDSKRLHLPIDRFFHSLGEVWREKAIAIVLSGTGADGTAGIMDVRASGGLVIAQSEDSARFDGMPHSAISTGCVDIVLAPEKMGDALVTYRDATEDPLDHLPAVTTAKDSVSMILEALRKVYDLDFSLYKPQTIMRRVQRRLSLKQHTLSIEAYANQVREDPDALKQLYKDLLIGVTRFFRDPESFELLAETVIPDILKRLKNDEEVRVWICGCSTGEEAYSIAILFLEAFEALGARRPLKILATDVDQDSLQFAAAGVYPSARLSGMPETLRTKYFTPLESGHLKVTGELRKSIVFTEHNLLKDPPFSRMDLVSCRNLLIYLQSKAQTQAIIFFLFSLKLQGYLLLGPSEGLGDLANQFRCISRKWKLFAKVSNAQRLALLRSPLVSSRIPGPPTAPISAPRLGPVYDALLDRFIPSGILVNEQKEALHVFGRASRYLNAPTGRITAEIYYMTEGALRSAIMSALRRAEQTKTAVNLTGVEFAHGGRTTSLELNVEPLFLAAVQEVLYMVQISEQPRQQTMLPAAQSPTVPSLIEASESAQLHDLEQALQQTREALRSTVDALETSNQDLQTTNEELLASNEELQSTNEELQSVNEELYSVNSEHEAKIEQLDKVTSDLNNLIRSTDLATIFVNSDWSIRLFTPKALEIFPLEPIDTGRNLRDFQPLHPDPTLFADIAIVLKDGGCIEKSLQFDGQRAFSRRIAPYHDLTNGQMIGVALTYIDVTDLVEARRARERSEQRLIEREAHLKKAQAVGHVGSWVWHIPSDTLEWSDEAQRIFGFAPERALKRTYADFINILAEEDRPSLQAAVDAALSGNSPFSTTYCVIWPNGERRLLAAEGEVDRDEFGKPLLFTGTVSDITKQRAAERALREANEALQRANAAQIDFLATISHEIRTPLNSILSMSRLLEGTDPDDKENQQKQITAIAQASTALMRLVNDILDLCKIDAGELRLDIAPFALDDVCQELLRIYTPSAQTKGLTFDFTIEKDTCPGLVQGDQARIAQVLSNLMDNAIKFTDQGRIALDIKCHASDPSKASVQFVVTDTGVGIPAETQARITEPFVRADRSSTRRFPGTGLGLSIVKKLVEQMGGTFRLASEEGKGTTACVTLNLPTSSSEELERVTKPESIDPIRGVGLVGVRCLVVDDNPVNLQVSDIILSRDGAKVTCVESGAQAIALLRNNPACADVVLMDLEMPVMDGYEATTIIRGVLGLTDLPIIALTAGVLARQQDLAQEAGMDDFISKPIEPAQLVFKIRECVERLRGESLPVVPADPVEQQVGGATALSHLNTIDLAELQTRISKNPQQVIELLRRYFEDSGDWIEKFNAAQRSNDRDAMRRLAHTFKGASQHVSATRVAKTTQMLEEAIQAADEDDEALDVSALWAGCGNAISALRDELQVWLTLNSAPETGSAGKYGSGSGSGSGPEAGTGILDDLAAVETLVASHQLPTDAQLDQIDTRIGTTHATELNALRTALARFEFSRALECLAQLKHSISP